MSKYDNQLNRMSFLMEYTSPFKGAPKKSEGSVSYHTVGADGKVYGILREGSKYYIKTTEKGKETIAESYEYIGGFLEKTKNAYSSYNAASKHLESMIMNLNESVGEHKEFSMYDADRYSKGLQTLTEEARNELNRMHMILENSNSIGMNNVSDPEGKHSASKPASQSFPYTEGTDENVGQETNPKKANDDYTDVSSNVEGNLTSDKAPSCKGDACKGEQVKSVEIDGESVATKKKMNESEEGFDFDEDDDYVDELETGDMVDYDDPDIKAGQMQAMYNDHGNRSQYPVGDDDFSMGDEEGELGMLAQDDSVEGDLARDDMWSSETPEDEDDELVGMDDEEDFDTLLENAENLLKTKKTTKKASEPFTLEVVTESFEEKIQRMVNEEITRLNAWGKHPKYGKAPMTLPDNHEVIVNAGDRDFNDDSTKGNMPYGRKIGSSAPFDKVVDAVAKEVTHSLLESLKKK